MKYIPLVQEIIGYLIVAILFMMIGAFLQWDSNFFFMEVKRG